MFVSISQFNLKSYSLGLPSDMFTPPQVGKHWFSWSRWLFLHSVLRIISVRGIPRYWHVLVKVVSFLGIFDRHHYNIILLVNDDASSVKVKIPTFVIRVLSVIGYKVRLACAQVLCRDSLRFGSMPLHTFAYRCVLFTTRPVPAVILERNTFFYEKYNRNHYSLVRYAEV